MNKLTLREINNKSWNSFKNSIEQKSVDDWTLEEQLTYLHNLNHYIYYCFHKSLNRSKFISHKIRNDNEFATYHRSIKNSKHQLMMSRQRRRYNNDVATPLWVDKKDIETIYKNKKEIEKQTGIKHHVDHIIPLVGKNEFGEHIVCGLNVPANLQIITATENQKKWCIFKEDQAY